MIR
ncbi:MAG: DUF218 domain, partial [Porphyrobacter sp. HL-46]|jgi:hypothetical protein|eukprot:gene20132-26139_t